MADSRAESVDPKELRRSDSVLVKECLQGNEAAWSALIDKYKNLIFSIPIKYDLSREESEDIFHSVIVDLLSELPRLREPGALPAWLIKVTSHQCLHFKRRQQRYVSADTEDPAPAVEGQTAETPEELLRAVELEQMLREAQWSLSPRCRRLVQMLFYEMPPRPYAEVAERLGIAKGSIGFIRQRCLARLRALLTKAGFR